MLQPNNITGVLLYFWVAEFLYVACVLGTKVSILLLYLRVFPETISKWFRVACISLIGLSVLMLIAVDLTVLFQCNPINFAWLRWDGEHTGSCINTAAQITATAAINVFLDLLVFFLPIPRLVTLNISTRKKISVCLTFLVGIFVTACSAIRLQYLAQWGHSKNPTWDYNSIAIWSSVECNIGVVCACMPAMAGFIKDGWKRAIGSRIKPNTSDRTITRTLNNSDLEHGSSRRQSGVALKAFTASVRSTSRWESSDEVELVEPNLKNDTYNQRG